MSRHFGCELQDYQGSQEVNQRSISAQYTLIQVDFVNAGCEWGEDGVRMGQIHLGTIHQTPLNSYTQYEVNRYSINFNLGLFGEFGVKMG